jgi:hypothetical protein
MPNKNPKKAPTGVPQGLVTRSEIRLSPSTYREDDHSIEFILATEEPARVWDWERFDVIKEIIVADGVMIPKNGQVPLVDSHDRSTIENILGSVREIRTQGAEVVGRLYFASTEPAKLAEQMIKDGHLDSGSVGYEQADSEWIGENESKEMNGRHYAGPVLLTKSWRLKEFSLVAVGADPNSKAREETVILSREAVDEEIQKEQSMETLNKPNEQPQIDTEAIKRAAIETERTRVAAISALCEKHELSSLTAKLIESGDSIEKVREIVLDEIAKKQKPVARAAASVEMGETDNEKFRAAAVDGLLIRGGTPLQKAAPGHEEFRGKSLLRLAEMCLQRAGVDTRNMTSSQIATAALRMRGAYTIAGSAADFTSIVLDASNKSLQKGYENNDHIWRYIASIGSAPDFKTINRIQLFEAQDLVDINENGSYTEAGFNDGKETYSLSSKGLRFTISRKALINDDTDAFSRIPRLLGASAARSIEKAVISLLTGGVDTTTTADGEYLFSAAHANISSGAALTVATGATVLGADMAKMMSQVGRGKDGSSVPAFAMPKFSLVPVALKLINDVICSSASLPLSSLSEGLVNPIKINGIVPLSSPYLDLSSIKRRYMLCDPNQSDSIEVSFLDGVQTPMLEEVDQTDADGRVFKVRLDVGAGILDYRGMVTNAGE